MATAMARAWTRTGWLDPANILASDLLSTARADFARETDCRVIENNFEVVDHADILILAVKPQVIAELLEQIGGHVQKRTPAPLVVSIAAGITLAQLQKGLGPKIRVVRVMPNAPCLVEASACAFSGGECATQEDLDLIQTLLDDVGLAFRLPENLLDAVTGLSGSGPAFVYLMIEALSDGGVRAGLPRDVATALAAQTALGAAKMVLETGHHPGVLKDNVASPGGTTIAGLHELERAGVRGAFMSAVEAAARRSTELGKRG